jgi:hypothetical protein
LGVCRFAANASNSTTSKVAAAVAGAVRASAMYASVAAANASPGGSAIAFCDPVSTKSSPDASKSSGSAPSAVTLSTRQRAPCARAAAPSAATSVRAPLEVSECATVTAE